MPLSAGTRLGPYEIVSAIGAGGMGEVYRAHDRTLDRDVAIKILPDTLAADPERIARFEREAKTLAALNHPHIAHIHGIEQSQGIRALVMELVEGEDLAGRVVRGALPIDEVLPIARQIAEALEYAHEHGVVHRDLKPANIKLTPDGAVKVLDFGLAKAMDAGGGASHDMTNSPTITSPAMMTRAGVILGTAAYMSPEQAKGKAVDKRTDIWAFGCVLYELLTGQRAFAGDDVTDLVVAVMTKEPDWSRVPPATPPRIIDLLKRCLKKSPRERLHDVADARLDIEDAIAAGAVDAGAARVTGGPVTRGIASRMLKAERLAWLAFALIVAVIAGASPLFRPPSDQPLVQFPVLVPENYDLLNLAVSPDGRHIALVASRGANEIWIRDFNSFENHPLPDSNGDAPFWSPDGASIGFFSLDGKLKRIPVGGGAAVTVSNLPSDLDIFSGGTWNTAGDIVFGTGGELYRVSANGGTPAKLDLHDQPQRLERGKPSFLPDGRHFIYRVLGSKPTDALYVGSLDSAESQFLTEAQSQGIYTEPGYVLFVRGNSLIAQPFNAKSLRLTGEPVAVGQRAAAGLLDVVSLFSASSTGTLAFGTLKGGHSGQLTWFDRARNRLSTIPEFEGSEYLNPSLSPDGKRLAANRLDPQTGNWDIWTIELQSGIASRFTTDPAQDSDAVWSQDGHEIVFASNRGGHFGLYRKSVTSPGPEELLTSSDVEIFPTDWSADGRFVIYNFAASLVGDVYALPLVGNRKPQLQLHGEHTQFYGGRLSPDGKWIAYSSTETGHYEVYVQPFNTRGRKVRVSPDSGIHPRWRGDGREFYFWNLNDNGIYAVDVAVKDDALDFGTPRLMSPQSVKILPGVDGRTHYDITRDGTRLLLRTPSAPASPPVTVMLNWTKALKR